MTTVVVVNDDGSCSSYGTVSAMVEAYNRQVLMDKLERVEFNTDALTITTTDMGVDIEILEVDAIAMFIADNAALLRSLL